MELMLGVKFTEFLNVQKNNKTNKKNKQKMNHHSLLSALGWIDMGHMLPTAIQVLI